MEAVVPGKTEQDRPLGEVIRDIVALTKPKITASVILTTAGGMWLAPGTRPWHVILVMLATTVAVVGSANSLNCWLERDSDRFMQRTRNRPLPDGRLQPNIALWLGGILAFLSVPTLSLVVNPMTGLLGAIALVSYVAVYTPMKRTSSFSLLVGSVPGALPPLMGWTAITGTLDAPGLVLFGILFFWQVPHFIAIAIYRKHDYEAAGLKTLPSERGEKNAAIQGVLYAGALLVTSVLLWVYRAAGPIYLAAALILGGYQLAMAVRLVLMDGKAAPARKMFFSTLIYLVGLFAALAIDLVVFSL